VTAVSPEIEEPVEARPVAAEPSSRFPATMWAAIAAVLAWFAITLARFIGEAPDLDSLIGFRGSALIYRDGFGGLVRGIGGEGVHPPVMDLVNFAGFMLFGPQPSSIQLMSIPLFVLFAAGLERLLSRYVESAPKRVLAVLAIAICPALALPIYSVWREAMMTIVLVFALLLALRPGGVGARPLALGLVLALLPLTKETGIVFVVPFAVDAFLTGTRPLRDRARRVAYALGIPVLAMVLWRLLREIVNSPSWQTWVFSEHADDGPYVVAARAMFGFEDGVYLRQNLANAFIVNYLWLPALLALVTLVLVWRRRGASLRRPVAILVGLATIYAWTTLTYPTFTEPRYATPVILITLLVVVVGLRLWPRGWQIGIIAALLFVFVAGAWSPTDPVSREIWGTTSVGGEQIYDTAERQRGPDRMNVNFATLNASVRMNARLRRIYASGATLVVGDCNAMKFGEKLAAVGDLRSWFDRGLPGARPLRCVFPKDVPAGAANGPDKIALVRTPEEDAAGLPPAITGPAVVVIH
jgi:hypothetical protein